MATYGKLAMYAGGEGWGEELVFQFVSGSYFPLLGVRPHVGRLIGPEDNVEGAQPVVVLSWALWQSRFGGDPDVVGRPIRLQDGEGRVIGVMPKVYEGLTLDWNTPTDLWLPDDPEGAIDIDGDPSTPGIFETLGVPVVAGRGVSEEDGKESVIINRTLAEHLWPDQDPIGKRFLLSDQPARVVGVVARERCRDLLAEPRGCVWRPITDGIGTRTIYVRTVGDADAAIAPLRDLILELDRDVQVLDVQSLDTFLGDRVRAERLAAVASSGLALFGVVLLVLGCVSLFVSIIRDSLREIAIRMALGATDGRIVRTVVGYGLLVAGIGTALGVGAALAVTRRIGGQLYGVSPSDPMTFTSVPTGILPVAAASVAYAALTATRSDPAEHLHAD